MASFLQFLISIIQLFISFFRIPLYSVVFPVIDFFIFFKHHDGNSIDFESYYTYLFDNSDTSLVSCIYILKAFDEDHPYREQIYTIISYLDICS